MTSQINPNNIDGNYPVAGVSNNTQGMRDNFTNIKTNFQYAEDEIDDLQLKGLFKSALTGTVLDNNLGNNLVYNAQLRGMSETVVAIAATSGTISIDCNAAPFQTIAITGDISLNFTAGTWAPAGSFGMLRLRITVDAIGRTMTLPAAVTQGTATIQGISSNILTFAAAGTFEFGFSTYDGGTTITMYDYTRPGNYYTNPVTIASATNSTSTGTGALIVAGGAGITGNLYVGGNIIGTVVATGNTFVGNTTVGNLLTSGFVTATGNVTGGNVLTGGLISATGNLNAANLNAVGLSLSGNIVSAINLIANITTTANIQGGNVKSTGILSATANVIGGNILTLGLASAAGNITGGNLLTAGIVQATGNLLTAGNVSATANVIAGNIQTGGGVTATANVVGGNVQASGAITATGNVNGGNVLSLATMTSVGNITGGNIITAGLITAIGNITGGNVLGGANVNATLHTGTTVSVTANVTGGNILSSAVVSAVGNARILSGTAIPAGGTTGAGYRLSSTANFGIFFGSGAPTLTAAKGSLYLRSDGSTTNDRMYINTDGATAWTSVITAS